ncbi:hypothetical protein XELAEV_18032378mg [Xenopus laevis]|uniref:DUF4371 domain-containing protein n=1 Tax=Xenopus laevis TaxID=8355 RepID=A0A974CPV5_XENLA|nr:hypothetical protein XELAEV_18032378mg [Xenopus laevis]
MATIQPTDKGGAVVLLNNYSKKYPICPILYTLPRIHKDFVTSMGSIVAPAFANLLMCIPYSQMINFYPAGIECSKCSRIRCADALLCCPAELELVTFTVLLVNCLVIESHSSLTTGYSDWKNVSVRLAEHEGSENHRKSLLSYVARSAKSGTGSQIDSELKKRIEKFGNAGKGKPSYRSSTTCLEFIELMGEHEVGNIINKIKIAKYFSIIVNSTLHVAHTDQLTFIVRYVSLDGCIEERFLKFLPVLSHTEESLFHSVLTTLDDMGIDIRNCRGYDNAANMSGAYKAGLQPNINNRIETLKTLCDTRWYQSYSGIHHTFGFLNNVSSDDLHILTTNLQKKYTDDLEDDFANEICQTTAARGLLQLIRQKKLLSVFPNVNIALRLFMTLPVTNASGERSFSKLSQTS